MTQIDNMVQKDSRKVKKWRLEIRDAALATKREEIIAEKNTIRASCQAMAEQKAALEEAIAKFRAAVFKPRL